MAMTRVQSLLLLFTGLLSCCHADSQLQNSSFTSKDQCGIWIGMSTIPGAGIGMYAGKDFRRGDVLLPVGDLIIPIVDLWRRYTNFFLWDEYTWKSHSGFVGSTKMGAKDIDVASPGFGASINSIMDFVNVYEEDTSQYSVPDNLHRLKDPEAGAFTYHHSRMSYADVDIRAGEELFNDYGDQWFTGRVKKLGIIPVTNDHAKAEKLYRSFADKLLSKYEKTKYSSVIHDMWDAFVIDPNNFWKSSVFAALPPKEDYQEMEQLGLHEMKRKKMTRSQEWLEQHALCVDHFVFDKSTIPKAGHGVFASHLLAAETVVLPVPLIHIPDRSVLDMQQPRTMIRKGYKRDYFIRKQLLLNYCLGHAESTMLLSPYGPVFNLINHNQTLANVRLQWALPERSAHNPDMLKKNVSDFTKEFGSRLAMELVTLRDIQPGEEIFLDYGNEWEMAWKKHVATWRPLKGARNYTSAHDMNKRKDRLKTVFEEIDDPYPANLILHFRDEFTHTGPWKNSEKKGHDKFPFDSGISDVTECEILRYEELDGEIVYAAVLASKNDTSKSLLIEQLPREAFEFSDAPYTADTFLHNAFRHDIRIPDEIFPDAWRNLQ
eukprot:scaffold1736_cov127-Cylindrotheca_fusiformis.AAC.26